MIAVVGAVPLALAGPLSLLDATSPHAVVLSVAVGVAGFGLLVQRGRPRVGACLVAAVVTSGAAVYAFVVAPLALIAVTLLVSAAVAAPTVGRARVPS